MLEQVKKNTGKAPDKVSMDAGDAGEDNIVDVEALGTETFIATSRKNHGDVVPAAPRGRIPKKLSVMGRSLVCTTHNLLKLWRNSSPQMVLQTA